MVSVVVVVVVVRVDMNHLEKFTNDNLSLFQPG